MRPFLSAQRITPAMNAPGPHPGSRSASFVVGGLLANSFATTRSTISSGVGTNPRMAEPIMFKPALNGKLMWWVELRLPDLAAGLAKEDVVIGVRIKRRIEINEIDASVRKFFPVGKPFE